MSQIIRYLKCPHCGKEYDDIYISFGHPVEDFIWKWECKECHNVNEYLVGALPWW